MRRAMAAGFLVAVGVVAAACGKGEDGKDKAKTVATTTAHAPTPTAAATTAHAATAAAPTAAPAKPPPLPAGRSNAPTLDEWAKMPKEVTVKGSTALKCETKIVREYLRVSCRGKADPEGTPTGIKILKGGRGEAMTYAGPGVTSLILPYVEGTDFEAVFSWTRKSHKLAVKWPKGAKQPTVVGVFEGAASPLDGTAKGDAAKLCDCHKKTYKTATCDDMMGGADADCDRTYGNNCAHLLECSRGEPGRWPSCLPGLVNAGPTLRCYKQCGPGKEACPAGHFCSSDWGTPICMEP
jgi:hypothetical protein